MIRLPSIGAVSRGSTHAGDRSMLSAEAIQYLARELWTHPTLSGWLPGNAVAVQCTLFDESPDPRSRRRGPRRCELTQTPGSVGRNASQSKSEISLPVSAADLEPLSAPYAG